MAISSHKENFCTSGHVRVKRLAFLANECEEWRMKLRIKEMRRERGWTQEHVAEVIGSTKSHVSEMESGKKNASTPMLEKLAKAFNVSVPDLIDAGELSGELHELTEIMKKLSADDRRVILRSAAGLLSETEH